MTERAKLTIADKINHLQHLLRALRNLQKKITKKQFFSEEMVRRVIERYLQLALEATLDIADHIISEQSFRKPAEYKDTIFILGENGVLSKKFAFHFAPAAGFRNILVHDYVRLDNKKVFEHFKHDVADIEMFIRAVVKYLKKV